MIKITISVFNKLVLLLVKFLLLLSLQLLLSDLLIFLQHFALLQRNLLLVTFHVLLNLGHEPVLVFFIKFGLLHLRVGTRKQNFLVNSGV